MTDPRRKYEIGDFLAVRNELQEIIEANQANPARATEALMNCGYIDVDFVIEAIA